MSRLPSKNKKIYILFFSYHLCIVLVNAFCKFGLSKTSNKDILKTITASSLRFGQLKEDGEQDSGQANGWAHRVHERNFIS